MEAPGAPKQFASPEEEVAYLRGEIAKHEREAPAAGTKETPQASFESRARAELGAYSRFTPKKVLKEHYQLTDEEIAGAAERAKGATDRAGEIVGVAAEKGVRNALSVLEKLDDAYLTDEVHRRLVEHLRAGTSPRDLKEGSPLFEVFNMMLFSVALPGAREETSRPDGLKALISTMEQFYSGMQSISPRRGAPKRFVIELAVSDKSDEIVFYVAVPTLATDLFEKQLLSLYPEAILVEERRDYNVFVEGGTALVATASLQRHPAYPLRSYEEFDSDPVNVLLNAFSKIDKEGGGAALQLVLSPLSGTYRQEYERIAERVRDGVSPGKAISLASFGGQIVAGLKELVAPTKKDDEAHLREVDQGALEQFEAKISRPIMAANLRLVASATDETRARRILGEIEASFNQFENTSGNALRFETRMGSDARRALRSFTLREYRAADELPLSLAELAGLVHFPSGEAGVSPQYKQTHARSSAAPLNLPPAGTLLGINTYRGVETKVYVTPEDRLRHLYIIGQTGTGKTTLMKNMLIQDIEDGNGVCMIDPHGTDIADVLAAVPPEREGDVIYFDPANTERSLGLNMLEYDPAHPEQKTFVVNELFSIFQKLYGAVPESMGPMFEQYFRNATMLVLDDPASGSTLMDVSRVLADADYRALKLSRATNPVVRQFWEEIATKAGGEAALENIVPYITSKFDIFTANDYMRPIIGQQTSAFNFRKLMDERKILLVNLSKGRLGEINANLIGMIIVGKLLMAALSRVDDTGQGFAPFYLHMDEFQNVTTDSIAAILSEARKYKLGLTIAHQYIAQLDEKIRDAVFGNVGSLAAFRVGPEDAEFLESQFAPTFAAHDLMNIENRHAYVRVLANGTPQQPFDIATVAPRTTDQAAVTERIARLAAVHGRPRAEVEAEINARYQR